MARPRKSQTGAKRARPRAKPRATDPESREPLVDARIRPLLERYVAIVRAELTNIADGLVELSVPATEQQWFQNRESIRIAFTLDALERDPDAEIAVAGSPFTEQLIAAIRARGSRVSYGTLPPEHAADAAAAELRVPITNGSARAVKVDVAWHRVVRLLARVVVRGGSEVEEHLLESGYIDATTGAPVPTEIARQIGLRRSTSSAAATTRKRKGATVPHAPSRSIADLVSLAMADLRTSLDAKVHRLRKEAHGKLQEELQRLDGYFASLLADSAGRAETEARASAQRAVEAEHARRRAEEERRHQVRAIVHPVQLTECELLVQRAHWELIGKQNARATLIAERWLNGDGNWSLACPGCGATAIASLSLCKSGHIACDNCASTCGACGRDVCNEHARLAEPSAPHGARWLCTECARVCEGGSGELVGADEVTRCATCDKDVCEHHSAPCAEDGAEHCREHMSKLWREPGKFICGEHGAICHVDRGVYRVRETRECPVCANTACTTHHATCRWCGRSVCVRDIQGTAGRCRTCVQLRESAQLPASIVDAVGAALGVRSTPTRWKTARDATHTIVEVDLGWTRRAVLLVRHGETVATVGRTHSALNSRKLDRSA